MTPKAIATVADKAVNAIAGVLYTKRNVTGSPDQACRRIVNSGPATIPPNSKAMYVSLSLILSNRTKGSPSTTNPTYENAVTAARYATKGLSKPEPEYRLVTMNRAGTDKGLKTAASQNLPVSLTLLS